MKHPTFLFTLLDTENRLVTQSLVSSRNKSAERRYPKQHEILTIYWSVQRLKKYLFGSKSTIIFDREIYSVKSLRKFAVVTLQPWYTAISE